MNGKMQKITFLKVAHRDGNKATDKANKQNHEKITQTERWNKRSWSEKINEKVEKNEMKRL